MSPLSDSLRSGQPHDRPQSLSNQQQTHPLDRLAAYRLVSSVSANAGLAGEHQASSLHCCPRQLSSVHSDGRVLPGTDSARSALSDNEVPGQSCRLKRRRPGDCVRHDPSSAPINPVHSASCRPRVAHNLFQVDYPFVHTEASGCPPALPPSAADLTSFSGYASIDDRATICRDEVLSPPINPSHRTNRFSLGRTDCKTYGQSAAQQLSSLSYVSVPPAEERIIKYRAVSGTDIMAGGQSQGNPTWKRFPSFHEAKVAAPLPHTGYVHDIGGDSPSMKVASDVPFSTHSIKPANELANPCAQAKDPEMTIPHSPGIVQLSDMKMPHWETGGTPLAAGEPADWAVVPLRHLPLHRSPHLLAAWSRDPSRSSSLTAGPSDGGRLTRGSSAPYATVDLPLSAPNRRRRRFDAFEMGDAGGNSSSEESGPQLMADQSTLAAVLQTQNLPPATTKTAMPKFAWAAPSKGKTEARGNAEFRRYSSSSDLDAAQDPRIGPSLISTGRGWGQSLLRRICQLLRILWICFVLGSVIACARNQDYAFSLLCFAIALVVYGLTQLLIWFLVSPVTQTSYQMLLSRGRRRHLEHQFELKDGGTLASQRKEAAVARVSVSPPAPPRRLTLGRSVTRRKMPLTPQANRTTISNAYRSDAVLPYLVWSAATNRNFADSAGGNGSRATPYPIHRVTSESDVRKVLHVMSQPDIGVMQRKRASADNLLALQPRRRLPQIREDRARQAGRMFSENEWQALFDAEVKRPDPYAEVRGFVKMVDARIKAFVGDLATSRTFLLGVIIRNVGWCVTYGVILSQMRRESHADSWRTDYVANVAFWIEAVFQWQLSFDFILTFIAAMDKLAFLWTFTSLIDILTLPMTQAVVQLIWMRWMPFFAVAIGPLRFFRLFRLAYLIRSVFPAINTVRLMIFGLALDTAIILFAFGCSMYLVEAPQPSAQFVTVLDYIYYAIVTMTTVGFGDYIAFTKLGRLVTSAAILFAFCIFPYHVQRLLAALHVPPTVLGHMPSMSSDFILFYGKIRPRQLGVIAHNLANVLPGSVRHILVITPFSVTSFKPLLGNLGRSTKNLKICISQRCPTAEEMQLYCCLARTVIIFSDPKAAVDRGATDADRFAQILTEDQKTFIRVTKVQSWCWPNVPISVQLSHGVYGSLAQEVGAYHILCLEKLKLRCIARSVAGAPGFLPLVLNWYHAPAQDNLAFKFFETIERRTQRLEGIGRSSKQQHSVKLSVQAEHEHRMANRFRGLFSNRDIPTSPNREIQSGASNEMNFYHFFRGLRFQVYRFEFPSCMRGVHYSLVCRSLYHRYGVFLIGLVTIDKRFYLNPVGYIIGSELNIPSKDVAAYSQYLGPRYPMAGVILSPSLESVITLCRLRRFDVAENTKEAESRFLARNFRSEHDLRNASLIFLDTLVKVRAEENANVLQVISREEQLAGSVNVGTIHTPRTVSEEKTIVLMPPSKPTRQDSESILSSHGLEEEPAIREVMSAIDAFGPQTEERPLILVCGWPKDLVAFLHAVDVNRPSNIVIIAAHDAPAYARWNHQLEVFADSCVWLHGSALSIEDLRNAGALLAHSIIILSSHHAFAVEGTSAGSSTPIDNQAILVRQQLFALFSRVNEYLRTLQFHSDEGLAASPRRSEAGEEFSQGMAARQSPILLSNHQLGARPAPVAKPQGFKLPFIVTELQDRENVEYLSSPRDLFLLAALKSIGGRDRSLANTALLTRLGGQEHADDAEWAIEGGRKPDDPASKLGFNFGRNPLDFSGYAIQSEYRAGRLFVRELEYPLVGYSLPVSRFAIDTTLIEHLVDGSNGPIGDVPPRCEKYLSRSPLQLVPIPRIFTTDEPMFREVYTYLMKWEMKLVIAVWRNIHKEPEAYDVNPIEHLRGSEANELLINCPSPTMSLLPNDKLYVIEACPRHCLGFFNMKLDHATSGFH